MDEEHNGDKHQGWMFHVEQKEDGSFQVAWKGMRFWKIVLRMLVGGAVVFWEKLQPLILG
ncbi:hypothetical protein [Neisseria chenwenguii]|uniref:hypothetical protein n=1 Tax=Neisseria chenwenguii TaxID=1853278 RepID=UPI000F5105BC|nr:hypothetical protein [Neisseria chenwenguii]ROV56209.1 hypothetical protein EGS38_05645 [Neisseria chenwenguii]